MKEQFNISRNSKIAIAITNGDHYYSSEKYCIRSKQQLEKLSEKDFQLARNSLQELLNNSTEQDPGGNFTSRARLTIDEKTVFIDISTSQAIDSLSSVLKLFDASYKIEDQKRNERISNSTPDELFKKFYKKKL